MSDVDIRKASAEDFETVMWLYEETQRWLAVKGLDQWQPNGEDQDRLLARVTAKIRESISRGTCFLAERSGEVIGTITIDDFADPEFWLPEDLPGDALYIHRMIIRRADAGENLGAVLLVWAGQYAARRGKKWLRLDAWQTNEALHRYYLSQGFTHVRTYHFHHRGSGALFQRDI